MNYAEDYSDFLANDEDMNYFVRIESHLSPEQIKRKKIKKKILQNIDYEFPIIQNLPSFKKPRGQKNLDAFLQKSKDPMSLSLISMKGYTSNILK